MHADCGPWQLPVSSPTRLCPGDQQLPAFSLCPGRVAMPYDANPAGLGGDDNAPYVPSGAVCELDEIGSHLTFSPFHVLLAASYDDELVFHGNGYKNTDVKLLCSLGDDTICQSGQGTHFNQHNAAAGRRSPFGGQAPPLSASVRGMARLGTARHSLRHNINASIQFPGIPVGDYYPLEQSRYRVIDSRLARDRSNFLGAW